MQNPTLQALKYTRGQFEILDQKQLPFRTVYLPCVTTEQAWVAIREMQVRGAPAIALTAVLGLAVEVWHLRATFTNTSEVAGFLASKLEYLKTSRPTAVNLFEAVARFKNLLVDANSYDTPAALIEAYVVAAELMLTQDTKDNLNIGKFGAELLLKLLGHGPLRVMTHCNTGSLATSYFGTALGIIRQLWSLGELTEVFATETRPYNQGARLTMYELLYEGIPATLITDSMASFAIQQKHIQAIVIGADRVAANGDTANKIGSYQLAITAKFHGIPFIVAAPTTSIDPHMPSGMGIVIEERPAQELTHYGDVPVAAPGARVWNPGFDVTPGSLITAIVTERGVCYPPYDFPVEG